MRFYVAPVLALLGTACTTYTPVAAAPTLRNDPVRVQLNQEGTVGLASVLGAGPAELDGVVQSVTDSSVVLSVARVTTRNGVAQAWNGELTSIPLRDVSSIAIRRMSVARSVLLAGIITGGVYVVGRTFGRGNSSGTQISTGGTAQ